MNSHFNKLTLQLYWLRNIFWYETIFNKLVLLCLTKNTPLKFHSLVELYWYVSKEVRLICPSMLSSVFYICFTTFHPPVQPFSFVFLSVPTFFLLRLFRVCADIPKCDVSTKLLSLFWFYRDLFVTHYT